MALLALAVWTVAIALLATSTLPVPSPSLTQGSDREPASPGPVAGTDEPKIPSTTRSGLTPFDFPDRGATPRSKPRRPTVRVLDKTMRRRGLSRMSPFEQTSLTFSVASFNVLGASHTRGPKARRGYAVAEARLRPQIELMENYGITVAGLQEFQYPQVNQLRQLRGSRYDVYPGTSLGNHLADNSIIWDTSTWVAVEKETTGVPYFNGALVQMPHVLLQHRVTGKKVWFGNYHNPANVAGDAAGSRARAVQIEADLATQLGSSGTPVIMTGDMNDRAAFLCPFTARSGMSSADGGHTAGGTCYPPDRMSVDWIVGSSDITFEDYVQDWQTTGRKLSDHPLVTATATFSELTKRPGCVQKKARKKKIVHYCRDSSITSSKTP